LESHSLHIDLELVRDCRMLLYHGSELGSDRNLRYVSYISVDLLRAQSKQLVKVEGCASRCPGR
jgi:hypothetical protein